MRDDLRLVILLCAVQFAGQLTAKEFLTGSHPAKFKKADADEILAMGKLRSKYGGENLVGEFNTRPLQYEGLQPIKNHRACISSAVESTRSDGI